MTLNLLRYSQLKWQFISAVPLLLRMRRAGRLSPVILIFSQSEQNIRVSPSLVNVLSFLTWSNCSHIYFTRFFALNNYEWLESCMPVPPKNFIGTMIYSTFGNMHSSNPLQFYSYVKLSECKAVCLLQISVYCPLFCDVQLILYFPWPFCMIPWHNLIQNCLWNEYSWYKLWKIIATH